MRDSMKPLMRLSAAFGDGGDRGCRVPGGRPPSGALPLETENVLWSDDMPREMIWRGDDDGPDRSAASAGSRWRSSPSPCISSSESTSSPLDRGRSPTRDRLRSRRRGLPSPRRNSAIVTASGGGETEMPSVDWRLDGRMLADGAGRDGWSSLPPPRRCGAGEDESRNVGDGNSAGGVKWPSWMDVSAEPNERCWPGMDGRTGGGAGPDGKSVRRSVAGGLAISTSWLPAGSSSQAPFMRLRTTRVPFSPSVPSALSPLNDWSSWWVASSVSLSAQLRDDRGLDVRAGAAGDDSWGLAGESWHSKSSSHRSAAARGEPGQHRGQH